jgi:nucleoid-associated protein EbfC
MFEGIKDMGKILKQAKEMKSKMKDVQSALKQEKSTGTELDGKIKVVVTGELECESITIDQSVVDPNNVSKLEKAILNAYNKATKLAKDSAASKFSAISGNMQIPGM